jgi:hypothetical protein
MAKAKKQAAKKTAKKTAAVVAQVAPQVAKADAQTDEVKGMRCYLVSCGPLTKLAGTNALARAAKTELVEKTGRRKSDATIEDHVIPYGKPNLIAYLNAVRADYEQRLLDSFNPPGAATKV